MSAPFPGDCPTPPNTVAGLREGPAGDGFTSMFSPGVSVNGRGTVSVVYPEGVGVVRDNASTIWKPAASAVVNATTLDTDADGLLDWMDNCPLDSNLAQTDVDADGAGDVTAGTLCCR